MILEYRTESHTWNMVDGDISFCFDMVEDEIKKAKEEKTDDKWNKKISNILKEKVSEAGFLTEKPHCKNLTIITDKEWDELNEIMIVAVSRKNGYEIFIFDYFYDFRILYNDGTIVKEFGN